MKSPSIITLFFTLFFAFSLFSTPSLAAWEGFDQENNTDIEIPTGNLVREGLVIEFYSNDELHLGRINAMNTLAAGLEIIIEDLNDGTERTFIMR